MKYFKREIKRYQQKLTVVFEPLAILGLIALIALPIFVVQNLNVGLLPQKATQTSDSQVLGTSDRTDFHAEVIGGKHNVFSDINLEQTADGIIRYSALVEKYKKGSYSKPVLKVNNPTEQPITVLIGGRTNISSRAVYGIQIDNKKYVVQNYDGARDVYKILIPSKSSEEFYLTLDSDFASNSQNQFELTISVL